MIIFIFVNFLSHVTSNSLLQFERMVVRSESYGLKADTCKGFESGHPGLPTVCSTASKLTVS